MSEHEFDSYLALLSGMLGLSDAQREAISGELRDHMLERMHALVAVGVPRDEAISKALEEFGDASRLASGLAAAAAIERRRRIMRWTVGTLSTFGLALFVGMIFWPSGDKGPTPRVAQAQEDGESEKSERGWWRIEDTKQPDEAPREVAVAEAVIDPNEVALRKLRENVRLDFIETPLTDVVAYLADETGLQIAIDSRALDDMGVSTDEVITFSMRDIPAFLAMELMLRPLDLGVTILDGVVLVTSREVAESEMLVRCYAVDDLLAAYEPLDNKQYPEIANEIRRLSEALKGVVHSVARDSTERFARAATEVVRAAKRLDAMPVRATDQVVSLVTTTIDEESWDQSGGPGSVQMIGGTLVVKNSVGVHWRLENFLKRLRRALKDAPAQRRPAAATYPTAQPALPPTLDPNEVTIQPRRPHEPVPNSAVPTPYGAKDDSRPNGVSFPAVQPGSAPPPTSDPSHFYPTPPSRTPSNDADPFGFAPDPATG